jgi:hypothetical protein
MHDGIQSEVREGPTNQVLLFRIASDDAMHWVWGDIGAYYIFVGTDRLAAGDFSMLDASFEKLLSALKPCRAGCRLFVSLTHPATRWKNCTVQGPTWRLIPPSRQHPPRKTV